METRLPAGFVPAQLQFHWILAGYGLSSALVVFVLWIVSGKRKYLNTLDRLLMCWFCFSGLTHIILEGYYVFTPEFYKIKHVHFLAEIWKEFNNGDSRYAARDPTLVVLEGITAVLAGPACLWATYAIATRKAYRFTIQLGVSLGQLYGDTVYFVMPYLVGKEVSKPGLLYHWFYFVFMNGIWVIVPLLISWRSCKKITQAVLAAQKKNKSL